MTDVGANKLVLRFRGLIDLSLRACTSWLCQDDAGGLRMIDPVDKEPVVSHYGDSHLAAALIIFGQMTKNRDLVDQGIIIAKTVTRDWASSLSYQDFHHDFNNFALCLLEEHLPDAAAELKKEIRAVVLATRDSNHQTINWLPMRAYVNLCRHKWAGDKRYLCLSEAALFAVGQATNADGGIEDRIPKGSSFNPQYHAASLAGLQLLSRRFPDSAAQSDKGFDFLVKRMLPDGDINYCGRGTNQIFAWGPWLFSSAICGSYEVLSSALKFLEQSYPKAAQNHNILLNSFSGEEKSFWWDYHHCSVYHAHFLLWVVLAMRELSSPNIVKTESTGHDTGLECIAGETGGVSIFSGRSIYLAEAGPAVCALWLRDLGLIFKGGPGPWQGMFGKCYTFADTVMQNHFGLVSQDTSKRVGPDWLARRLGWRYQEDRSAVMRPIFAETHVQASPKGIEVVFETAGPMVAYLNIPIFETQADRITIDLSVDGSPLRSVHVAKGRNPYGWIELVRSHMTQGKRWTVSIRSLN